MSDEKVVCLDTSVLVKSLVAEEPRAESAAAAQLVLDSLLRARLVAPARAWAEVGSALRKKVRLGVLSLRQAGQLWSLFTNLPIEYVETPALRARAWEIAEAYALPALYDAAFLACMEVAPAVGAAAREFWTADDRLLRHLGANRPPYVRRLAEG